MRDIIQNQYGNPNVATTIQSQQNMTTLHLRKSIDQSPLRLGLFLIPLVLGCFALSPTSSSGSPHHRTEAIPTTTPLRVMMRSSASLPASTTRPSVLDALYSNTTGSDNTANGVGALIATQPATTTRPTVLMRSSVTQPATTTRPPVLVRSIATHRRRQHGQRC